MTSSYSYITATSRQTALVVFLEDCAGYQTHALSRFGLRF
nr:MAG TPA: hypothetical protein [Caudoviricetes sp.]